MKTVPQELKDQMTADHFKEICDLMVKLADKGQPVTVSLRKSKDKYILAASAHQYADAAQKKPQPVQMRISSPDQLAADLPAMLKELNATPDPVEEKPAEKKPAKPEKAEKPVKQTETKPKEEKPASSGFDFI